MLNPIDADKLPKTYLALKLYNMWIESPCYTIILDDFWFFDYLLIKFSDN